MIGKSLNSNPERSSAPCVICGKPPIYEAGNLCYCTDHRAQALARMKEYSQHQDSRMSIQSYSFDKRHVKKTLTPDGQIKRVR